MDPRFEDIFTSPENAIFKVVFYPDRIYHARYLSAARSPRYRYNVQEVRSKPDITVMKGEVFFDGRPLSNVLRLEYRAGRLTEAIREHGRRVREQVAAWVQLRPDAGDTAQATVRLHYDPLIDAHAVEFWETLEPPPGSAHHFPVSSLMGRDAPITCIPQLVPAMRDIKALRKLELAFREHDRFLPFNYQIGVESLQWDNNFVSSHEEPRTIQPSAAENTVEDRNYLIDFQRGWFLARAGDVQPVRYRNAMMEPDANPDAAPGNIIEMRWLLQREFGSSVVFFHEVTIPPGTVEGSHRHIGSEELYYIVSGEGVAYLGDGDDPAAEGFPLVKRHIFGIGERECREVPVGPGSVVFTKSGGIHGIANPNDQPLKFVAFLYHST